PFLLQQSPRRIGLFATRGPHRPNPIGLSLVRIERVAPPSMFVRGADFADGTPVLDIKPYVTAFDTPFGGQVRSGWFETVELPHGATPEQLRGGATAKGDDHPCG
ncbi:MAG TPA: TrmO family methyltransferase, partial [Acidimicrobiia bacterium]|nr:TrmO family methyltransferase [Acidimicrobiia bacterium]